MRRIFVLHSAMLRFRSVSLALLATAVAADFAWHFYAGEPESAIRARDIRRAPALQAGDIVLCGRIGLSGNVMRLAAKSPWTHAALAAGGDSASLLAPVKVSGSLKVRITRMAVQDFAQRCEAFGIARIGNCGEKCLAAARRAAGMEGTKSDISLGATGFGTFSGADFLAESFELPASKLSVSEDGSPRPVLPENILEALGAAIIFSAGNAQNP
jgi:hypothetical protein